MEKSLYQDSTFRKIVAGSTGFGLACMLGSLAALRIGQGTGLQFAWHWSILVVAAAVFIWTSQFWKTVWELQRSPTRAAKRKLGIHLGILVLLGIGSFLYPIHFVEVGYGTAIFKGLVTAIGFLGTMIWLIYKCGKALNEIDDRELQRAGQSHGA